MKNLIAILLCLIVLSGCKKSDSQTNTTTIAAKWTLKKLLYKFYSNNVLLKDSINNLTSSNLYIQFNNDGSGFSNINEGDSAFFSVTGNATGDFTYNIKDASLVVTYKISPITLTRPFSITADGLLDIHVDLTFDNAGRYSPTGINRRVLDEIYSR